MNLNRLAKESSHSLDRWLDASRELEKQGFDQEERAVILRAASRNRFHPVRFAQSAIRLRQHVGAGKPLS